MRSIIDRKKTARRALIANIASTGGLVAALTGVILPLWLPSLLILSMGLIVGGLGVAMVGIYFANRWVRKPRPEEALDKALKPFSDSYRLYHYAALPCDHVLLTPTGVYLLETVNLDGFFSYQNERWSEKMSFSRAVRLVVEEHLGDPIQMVDSEQEILVSRLAEVLAGETMPPVKALVVFTHPHAHVEVSGNTTPVVMVDKLRKQIPAQGLKLAPGLYQKLSEYFESVTI
jgi:hypothetical protein